jgi:hypothetical protein
LYFFTLRNESLLVAHLRVLVEKGLTATVLENKGWALNALNELVCDRNAAILKDWSIGVERLAIGVAISLDVVAFRG